MSDHTEYVPLGSVKLTASMRELKAALAKPTVTIPITDEMIERAAWFICPHTGPIFGPNRVCEKLCGRCRGRARAALEAALKGGE